VLDALDHAAILNETPTLRANHCYAQVDVARADLSRLGSEMKSLRIQMPRSGLVTAAEVHGDINRLLIAIG